MSFWQKKPLEILYSLVETHNSSITLTVNWQSFLQVFKLHLCEFNPHIVQDGVIVVDINFPSLEKHYIRNVQKWTI